MRNIHYKDHAAFIQVNRTQSTAFVSIYAPKSDNVGHAIEAYETSAKGANASARRAIDAIVAGKCLTARDTVSVVS